MKDFKTWTFIDRFPEKKLNEINPISLRCFSLLNRIQKDIKISDGAMNIIGAINIMEGLDYHYSNFLKLKGDIVTVNQNHEIVAYLNRLGQLYYFLKSDFVKNYVPEVFEFTPKIKNLSIFRMKNTAHRSIDYPKGESEEYQNRQAISLIGFDNNLEGNKLLFKLPIEKNGKTEWIFFVPESDHEIVMSEAYYCLEILIKNIT